MGQSAARLGGRAVLVRDVFPASDALVETIQESLTSADIELLGEPDGAAPNVPPEDLHGITEALRGLAPDVVISFVGGSTIDPTKAAEVLRTCG